MLTSVEKKEKKKFKHYVPSWLHSQEEKIVLKAPMILIS